MLRRQEFLAGRQAAYRALSDVGWRDADAAAGHSVPSDLWPVIPESVLTRVVPQQSDRSPGWPAGFVGSISHSRNWIVAVAASTCVYQSVGVDTEVIASYQQAEALKPEIGHRTEWMMFAAAGIELPVAFTLLFSAKEAFYKCWYPLHHSYLNFTDVVARQIQSDQHHSSNNGQSGTLMLERSGLDDLQLVVRYHATAHDIFTLATKDAASN